MARVIDEKQLKRLEATEKHEHARIIELRNQRLLSIIKRCHKLDLLHKIKSLFRKCKICKELENLR